MSANPLELFSVYGALSKAAGERPRQFPDRRRKPRTQLHWPLILFRQQQGGDAIESVTRDLSSRGFSCHSPSPFHIGELLSCAMRIPTHDPNGKLLERILECRVRVVRVMADAEGGFGIGCAIEDYHFPNGVLHGE